MKTRVQWLLSLLVALSLLLSACGAAATPVPVEPTEVPPTEEVVEDPEPIEVTEADLDAAYGAFIGNMQGYYALKMDPFVEMLAEEPAPFLLDVREPAELEEKGYIPGAVNIPLRELGQNLDKLPSFDSPIVGYCGSGWRCTIGITALGALGWEELYSLKSGSFGGYKEAGYTVETSLPMEAESLNAAAPEPAMVALVDETLSGLPEGWAGISVDDMATRLVEDPGLFVIDVRRQEEIEGKGYIEAENSVAIPLEEFIDRRAEWPSDPTAPVAIYCGSGHRSTIAMTIMRTYGYDDVLSMKGGFSAWASAGYPVAGVADLDGGYSQLLEGMVKYNTIGLADVNAMLAEEPPPFLLDVRQPAELEEKGHIPGAVNIPLRDLMKNLEKLPSFDTTIVSYCGSGWRCTIAMTALEAMGWEDVLSLKGGSFGGWVSEGYSIEEGLAPEAPALNAAEPSPTMVAVMDEVFSSIPDGYGGVTAETLATELVETPGLQLIDVRRSEELAEKGVIDAENQIHIPLEEFIARMDEWPEDKDAPVVVYCGSGHRSTMAMTILWTYGYTDVRSLKGGFSGWVEAGLPVAELATQ